MAEVLEPPVGDPATGEPRNEIEALRQRLGGDIQLQETADGIPNLWVPRNRLLEVMRGLKNDYPLLFDLSAVDERVRNNRHGLPDADFTVFYHLIS